MAKISISEAARIAGISRSALYRSYISQGKISIERDYRGSPVIDTSELFRVFGDTAKATEVDSAVQTEDTAHLQAEIARLGAMVTALQTQLDEAKERETWYRQKIDQLQPQALSGPEVKRRWWWPW